MDELYGSENDWASPTNEALAQFTNRFRLKFRTKIQTRNSCISGVMWSECESTKRFVWMNLGLNTKTKIKCFLHYQILTRYSITPLQFKIDNSISFINNHFSLSNSRRLKLFVVWFVSPAIYESQELLFWYRFNEGHRKSGRERILCIRLWIQLYRILCLLFLPSIQTHCIKISSPTWYLQRDRKRIIVVRQRKFIKQIHRLRKQSIRSLFYCSIKSFDHVECVQTCIPFFTLL